jgi:hypothetical protein
MAPDDQEAKQHTTTAEMTYREAIKFVRRLNEWRRGSEEIEQPDPREIGIALDVVCEGLEAALMGTPAIYLEDEQSDIQ